MVQYSFHSDGAILGYTNLQNNVAIVGTSDMTSEAQLELTRLFESYK